MAGHSNYHGDVWQTGSQMRLYPIIESIDTDTGEMSMEIDFIVDDSVDDNAIAPQFCNTEAVLGNDSFIGFAPSASTDRVVETSRQPQALPWYEARSDTAVFGGSELFAPTNTLPTPTYSNWHTYHSEDDYIMSDVSNAFDSELDRLSSIPENHLESNQPRHDQTRSSRFTKAQTNFLRAWIENNIDDPYPTSEEVIYLQMATGLGVIQIRNWFSRYRQRKHIMPLVLDDRTLSDCGSVMALSSLVVAPSSIAASNGSDNGESSCRYIDVGPHHTGRGEAASNSPGSRSSAYTPRTSQEDLRDGSETVLAWWLRCLPQKVLDHTELELDSFTHPWTTSHPPEPGRPEERPPFYWTQIQGSSSLNLNRDVLDAMTSNNSEPNYDSFDTSSEHSYSTTSGISRMSLPYGYHTSSSVSAYSSILNGSRKGRKRRLHNYTAAASRSSEQTSGRETFLPYQCGYCKKGFARKFTCKRHEQAVHQPTTVWICQPLVQTLSTVGETCYLCDKMNLRHEPGVGLCTHDVGCCSKQSESDRTFFRRDNFVQHLHGMHKMTTEQIQQINLSRWERKVESQDKT